MTVTHVGTSKKYTANWSQAFGKAKPAGDAAKPQKTAKPAAKKKTAKKAAKAKAKRKS